MEVAATVLKFLLGSPKTSGKIPRKPLVYLGGAAAILFGLGYALRPVADIVDELHDSDDDIEIEEPKKEDEEASKWKFFSLLF